MAMIPVSLLVTFVLAGAEAQIVAPPGKAPATVLSKQILPNGDVEILVPFDETFLLDGERVAFVTFYQCVRTSISGGRMTQRRERCLPRVEILPPPPTTKPPPKPTTKPPPPPTTTPRPPYIPWPYPYPYPYFPYVYPTPAPPPPPTTTTTTPRPVYPYPYPSYDPYTQQWYMVIRRAGYPDYIIPYPAAAAKKR